MGGGKVRGLVATKSFEEGEPCVVVRAGGAALGFGAAYAYGEPCLGLGDALRDAGPEEAVSDDAALALLVAVAEAAPADAALGPYVHALPDEPPDLPETWAPADLGLLPAATRDKAVELQGLEQVTLMEAREVAARMRAVEGSKRLSDDDLARASRWVRTRAMRVAGLDAETGAQAASKRVVPVVDLANAAPGAGGACKGPALRTEPGDAGGETRWVAARPVGAGEELTWTYGEHSDEEMLLLYGFVPDGAPHGDSRVDAEVPAGVFEESLGRFAGTTPELRARREALLRKAGVLGASSVSISVRPFEAPAELLAIGRILAAGDEDGELDDAGRAAEALAAGAPVDAPPLSGAGEARARRWAAWMLGIVEADRWEQALLEPGETPARRELAAKLHAAEAAVFSSARDALSG